MSLKRKLEDEEEVESTSSIYSSSPSFEKEFEEFSDQDDECDEEENDHIRNLGDKLCVELPPPAKKVKPNLPGTSGDHSHGGNQPLKLLQGPAVWIDDNQHPTSSSKLAEIDNRENLPDNGQKLSGATVLRKPGPYSQRTPSFVGLWSELSPGVASPSLTHLIKFKPRAQRSRAASYDPSKPTYLTTLADEILLKIFSFLNKLELSRCARTCQMLKRIAFDESLWRRVNLGSKSLPPGAVGQVLSRGAVALRLARASIVSPIFKNDFGTTYNFQQPSRLQYLDLSMATIEPSCLETLFKSCLSLKKLSLESCTVNDEVCKVLAKQNGSTLEVLHLAMVTGLNMWGMVAILSSCRNLQELNIAWTNLSASTWNEISDLFPSTMLKLNLSGQSDGFENHHLEEIVESCANLTELDVSDCKGLVSKSLTMIVKDLPNIESLSLSRCYNITPRTYLELKKSRSLRYLNVFSTLQEGAIEALKKMLPGVEINKLIFSSIARPTVGIKRSSIWNLRVRDCPSR